MTLGVNDGSGPLETPDVKRPRWAATATAPLAATGLAAAGVLIAAYLTATRLAGDLPACGPLAGCEQVATSAYSEVFGIPVAAFGLGYSLAVLVAVMAWWRTGSRRAVLAAYALGLMGLVVVAYLTYLELFVIHAICAWCVAYAATVALGWVVTALALRR